MEFVDKIKIWLNAARPKTLTASLSPVIVAIALAYSKGVINIPLSLLCIGVALFAQIASNYANDYFDFRNGIDNAERKGPERAVANGWVTAKQMLVASLIAVSLAVICGLGIICMTKWWLIFVGIAVVLCVYAYSAGPYPLSSNGLGDVAVMLFYGIIPVCATIYVLTGNVTFSGFLLSLSMGFVATNILIVNNYRDYETDMASGKKTSIVIYGKVFGEMLYIVCAAFALITAVLAFCITDSTAQVIVAEGEKLLSVIGLGEDSVVNIFKSTKLWLVVFVVEFAVLQYVAYRDLKRLKGKELNTVLALTARNVLIWAILLSILLVM